MNLDTPIIPIVSPDPVDDRPVAMSMNWLRMQRVQQSIHLLAS